MSAKEAIEHRPAEWPRLHQFDPRTEKIIVVGDLHGYLKAFDSAVNYWRSQKGSYLLFLGDYADRGPDGLEIIEALKILVTEGNVVALKGNHEDYSESGNPRFQPCTLISEVEEKRGEWGNYFRNVLKPFFSQLYLAALLPERILFVHGGVSRRIENIESLKQPSARTEEDILWSDPVTTMGERPNQRGAGVEFGPDVTSRVMDNLGVCQIIRSHQPSLALKGPRYSHKTGIVTLSSTNVYPGKPFFLELENRTDGLRWSVHFISPPPIIRS
jgi:hypothetical protein